MIIPKRLFILCIFLLTITTKPFAQTFICDTIYPNSEGSLLVAAIQLRDCLPEVDDIDSAKRLVQILQLNAVKYFDLARIYDTEEKLNAFKSSKAYKDTLALLTNLKKETLNTYFYSVLTNNLGKFEWSFKGFKFEMDKLTTPGGVIGAPPPPATMFYAIELSSLPFAISTVRAFAEGGPDQHMMLTVDPESGMNIDRDKPDTRTVVLYKLDHVTSKEYSYYNEQCHCNRNAKEEVIVTKSNRVIIYNVKTNQVYFDKTY